MKRKYSASAETRTLITIITAITIIAVMVILAMRFPLDSLLN